MNELKAFLVKHGLSTYSAARLLRTSQSKIARNIRTAYVQPQLRNAIELFGWLDKDRQQSLLEKAKWRRS